MDALARTSALRRECTERMKRIENARVDMHDVACIGADHFRKRAEAGHEGARTAYMNLQRAKKMME